MIRVDVLDRGFVELQSVMGDDLAIVNAARTSYLGESKGEEKDKKLLFYLYEHKHMTPFEMVEFKLRIKAPLVVWWQMVRHRTFSFNLQSGRYLEFDNDEFYVPDLTAWRKQSSVNKQGSDGTLDPLYAGARLTHRMEEHIENSFRLYDTALDYGVAKEQARLFLPAFALYYTGIVKADARNLLHFLELRMAEDAQHEIRVYAQAIYEHIFKPTLPWTAEAYEKSKGQVQ